MTKKIMFVLVIIVSMVTLSFSQGRNFRAFRNQNFHQFEISSLVKIDGKIVKVETVSTGQGWYGEGIHLTIASGEKQSVVVIGPAAYLISVKWQFKVGEKVSLTAFAGKGNSAGMLFASEVVRDGNQLILRDKYGMPEWRRSLDRRGRGQGRYGRRGYRGRGGRGYYRDNYRF